MCSLGADAVCLLESHEKMAANVPAVVVAQVGQHNRHRRALKAEKMAMRYAIYPVLQAEEDRRCAHL